MEVTGTIRERLAYAQVGQFKTERDRYAEALRFYAKKDDWEALQQYEALKRATAFQIAKEKGYGTIEQAYPEAEQVLGVA